MQFTSFHGLGVLSVCAQSMTRSPLMLTPHHLPPSALDTQLSVYTVLSLPSGTLLGLSLLHERRLLFFIPDYHQFTS